MLLFEISVAFFVILLFVVLLDYLTLGGIKFEIHKRFCQKEDCSVRAYLHHHCLDCIALVKEDDTRRASRPVHRSSNNTGGYNDDDDDDDDDVFYPEIAKIEKESSSEEEEEEEEEQKGADLSLGEWWPEVQRRSDLGSKSPTAFDRCRMVEGYVVKKNVFHDAKSFRADNLSGVSVHDSSIAYGGGPPLPALPNPYMDDHILWIKLKNKKDMEYYGMEMCTVLADEYASQWDDIPLLTDALIGLKRIKRDPPPRWLPNKTEHRYGTMVSDRCESVNSKYSVSGVLLLWDPKVKEFRTYQPVGMPVLPTTSSDAEYQDSGTVALSAGPVDHLDDESGKAFQAGGGDDDPIWDE